jgi:hypothetical protein
VAQTTELVDQHRTGAAAVVVAQQLLARMQSAVVVTEVLDAHHPSPEHPPHMPVVAVVAVAIAVRPATPQRQVEPVVLAVAATVDRQPGTEPTVALAQALTEQQVLVAAVAAVAIALEHKFLALQMVVEVVAVRELLCCVTCYLRQQPQTSPLHQTVVHHPQTTSQKIKHSPSREMPE